MIDKGIPPPRTRGDLRDLASEMRQMDVGDSMLVHSKHTNGAYVAAAAIGIKVTVRTNPDGSYRVWRTQ